MEMEEVFCYADDVDEEAQSVHQPPNKEIELQEISESNIVGKKLEEDEVPTRKNTMSENVKGCVHEHCDFFKYKDQSSNWGVLGTLVSFGLIIYMMYAYYVEWKKDAVTYNTKMRVRTDSDEAIFPSDLGAILYRNGNQFYDERYFRWNYKVRAIFRGDTDNSVHPRIAIEQTSPITCSVYGSSEYVASKNATKGCMNTTYFVEELRSLRVASQKSTNATNYYDDIPDEPIIQGQYGSEAYWFVQLTLIACDEYGADENITCVNSTQMENIFLDESWTIDLVMKSELSVDSDKPGDLTNVNTMWSNVYLNFDYDDWHGIETYLQLHEVDETERVFSDVVGDKVPLVKFSYFTQRSAYRTSNTYMTYWIRLDLEVEDTTIQRKTVSDAVANMGGSSELVWIVLGLSLYIPVRYIHRRRIDHKSD